MIENMTEMIIKDFGSGSFDECERSVSSPSAAHVRGPDTLGRLVLEHHGFQTHEHEHEHKRKFTAQI